MSLKPLVGSHGSVWFAVREVSVFLLACADGSSDTQTEQAAEWEMCVFSELFVLGFFLVVVIFFCFVLFQGISTIWIPS